MKIADSNVSLQSQNNETMYSRKEEELHYWNKDKRIDYHSMEETGYKRQAHNRVDTVNISQEAQNLEQEGDQLSQRGNDSKMDSIAAKLGDGEDEIAMKLPPKLAIMKDVVEMMTGRKIEVYQIQSGKEHKGPPVAPVTGDQQVEGGNEGEPQRQGWGLSYSKTEEKFHHESFDFNAKGSVKTEDGREINFDLAMHMSKETYESTHVSLKAGDALIDPLVINYTGEPLSVSDEKYSFDLDNDGENENISFVENGAGFLALDKNNNGIIDNGSELFGPETGKGFEELRQYDSDNNGWIDENDAIFYDLKLWEKDADGNDQYSTLLEKDVGALYLGNAETSISLEDTAQNLAGEMKNSSVYLKESGGAGFIHEIDLIG